jgi:hypothetical protein
MSRELRVVGAIASEIIVRHEDVTRLDTLEDVLHRGLEIVDVIVQDEYTHDVVCRGRRDGGFLVFDTT